MPTLRADLRPAELESRALGPKDLHFIYTFLVLSLILKEQSLTFVNRSRSEAREKGQAKGGTREKWEAHNTRHIILLPAREHL